MIRDVREEDVGSIADIYNYYIENTVVTFEETPVSVKDMGARIAGILRNYPFYVWHCQDSDRVLGYSHASIWKERSAYRHSAEVTVYLHPEAVGGGIGSKLYKHLLAELEARSVHAAMGGIALPNPASVALHEKFGFTKVAHFKEVGRKEDRWIDVGYWQRILKS
jgi:phosphinothricin acetyltransferase